MEKSKRILSTMLACLLVFTLVFAMTFSASAAGPCTITINKPANLSIDGQTFNAYKVFDLVYSQANNAYNYTLAPEFAAFTHTVGATTYTSATLKAYIETLTDDAAALDALAKDLLAFVTANSIAAAGSVTAGSPNVTSATITDLPYGHYLVTGTGLDGAQQVVAACALQTTDPNAVFVLKADGPNIEKEVQDAPSGDWGSVTDVNIGDTVNFRLTSAVPNMKGYIEYTYNVYDTFSAGLTYDPASLAVTVGGLPFSSYTASYNSTTRVLSIVFTPSVFITLTPGAAIVITYSAQLNENALVSGPGGPYLENPNDAELEYSNNPYDTTTNRTPKKRTRVYSFKFDVKKYTMNGTSEVMLPGAEFELRKTETGAPIQFMKLANNVYRVATPAQILAGGANLTTKLISGANGMVNVEGLDKGTYYLVETKAPDGYNPLDKAIVVVITPTYGGTPRVLTAVKLESAPVDKTLEEVSLVSVLNNTGTEFPETGGIGQTIFLIVGAILMLGAGVTLVVRRKLSASK